MIEILDVKDAEPKKLDITPELALAAYNTLIQFCRQQEGMPNLSGINQNGTMARYMIQARVIYKERKK